MYYKSLFYTVLPCCDLNMLFFNCKCFLKLTLLHKQVIQLLDHCRKLQNVPPYLQIFYDKMTPRTCLRVQVPRVFQLKVNENTFMSFLIALRSFQPVLLGLFKNATGCMPDPPKVVHFW